MSIPNSYNRIIGKVEHIFAKIPGPAPLKYMGLVVGVPLLAQGALQVAPAVADTLERLSYAGSDLLVRISYAFQDITHNGAEGSLLSVLLHSSNATHTILNESYATLHTHCPFERLDTNILWGIRPDGTKYDIAVGCGGSNWTPIIHDYKTDEFSSYLCQAKFEGKVIAEGTVTDGQLIAANGDYTLNLVPVTEETAPNYWPAAIISGLVAIGAGIAVWFKKRKRKGISRDKDITNIVR